MEVSIPFVSRGIDFFNLCKPKVVGLMLLTSWVGMILSTHTLPIHIFIFGSLGILFTASGAAVFNHLADRHIDSKMARTYHRPIASGRISPKIALYFACFLCSIGLSILYFFVNTLASIMTAIAMLGYALFYTLLLKYATPQNIVIGGLFGAAPPLLGSCAVTGAIETHAIVLVLIIFTWTPPHFWSLAIHRLADYKKAKIPMLPVTHGVSYTKLCILLYTILLFPITLLPFFIGKSGLLYLFVAIILDVCFLFYSIKLYRGEYSEHALKTFHFSIRYLLLLFAALLTDHYCHFQS